jgi:hypothetical protein
MNGGTQNRITEICVEACIKGAMQRTMIDRFPKFKLPATVDEAAEVLISDLTTQEMTTMADMSDRAFDLLYDHLAPYLQHDFRLWTGNDNLLFDCFENIGTKTSTDPMRIIMDCLRSKLQMLNDVIITV